MLIEGVDYFVHLVPFPSGKIDGAVTPNDDGTFSIYISASLDYAHRKKVLYHEVRHIELNHFYCDQPIQAIESEAEDYS